MDLHILLNQLVVALEHFQTIGMDTPLAQRAIRKRNNRARSVQIWQASDRVFAATVTQAGGQFLVVVNAHDSRQTRGVLREVPRDSLGGWGSFGGRDPMTASQGHVLSDLCFDTGVQRGQLRLTSHIASVDRSFNDCIDIIRQPL